MNTQPSNQYKYTTFKTSIKTLFHICDINSLLNSTLMSHFMAMLDAMNGVAPGVAPAPAPTAPAPVPGVISTIQIQYL